MNIMALPLVSIRIFSGVIWDFIMDAVPYLEAALLEITLYEEQILSQLEKESSVMLISCTLDS